MPKPNKGESKSDYIARFMSSGEAKKSFPDEKQRYAVALSWWKKYGKAAFSAFNQLKNIQNPSNMGNFNADSLKNLTNMTNFNTFNRSLTQIQDLLNRNKKK